MPLRRLSCDFDLLAVCLSLRRNSWRSPLVHEAAPPGGLEHTSGAQRESGGVSHAQSTQTAPRELPRWSSPEDPREASPHLSKASLHVGKMVSLPSPKPIPQPQVLKSAVVGKTGVSAVGPEEKSIHISQMDLSPMVPAGSSGPQKDVQVEAEELTTFLLSCPRSSGIPGMASLHQSPLQACPNDRRPLVQKLRGLPPPLHPGSGSPSSSETALLASTCPQGSRIPGLPSVECASRSDPLAWDRCSQWRKLPEGEEPCGFLPEDYARAVMVQEFSSGCPPKAFSAPSMAGLLHTCPTRMAVPGIPFRAKVVLCFNRWHLLRETRIHKPPRQKDNSVLVEEYLGLFCPRKAGGFPEEPHFVSLPLTPHSMVDFVQACPRRSRVLGLPSRDVTSSQNENAIVSLKEVGLNRGANVVGGISDSEKREISRMVAMLPSWPARTCLLIMPQKLLGRTGQVPVSPIGVQSPDPGFQVVSKAMDYRAQTPDKSTPIVFRPLTWKDSETSRDMVNMSSGCPTTAVIFGLPCAPRQDSCMVDLLPSCPGCTQICGLPSKATQSPGESKVPGMSLERNTNQIKWTVEAKSLLLPQGRSRFSLPEALMADEGEWRSVEEKPSLGKGLSGPGGLSFVQKTVQQKSASSARPLDTSNQVVQTCPGLTSAEISPNGESARKKTPSQTETGFWMSREKEDTTAMGCV